MTLFFVDLDRRDRSRDLLDQCQPFLAILFVRAVDQFLKCGPS